MRHTAGPCLSLLLLACSAPSWAAKTVPEKKVPAASDGKEQFLVRSTAPLTVESVLAHFELFDRELSSLRARFTQSVSMGSAGMASTVEGTLSYSKPEKLRITHEKPDRQTIVCDGKTLWIHRPSQNQAIQSDLKDWRQADPALNNLLSVGNYATMLRTYDVSLDTSGPSAVLRLRPKSKDAEPFELRLTLSRDTLFPRESELAVGEAVIRTRFDDLSYNPSLAASLFQFSPPEGVDVFRNYKPPRFHQ